MRVYVPATIAILQQLIDDEEVRPLNGTAFGLTPALREAYTSGTDEELEYAALLEAARASLRLLATEMDTDGDPQPRRVVIAADVDDAQPRPDLDHAVVRIGGAVPLADVAAVHVDGAEASDAVTAAAKVVDAADLGDLAAELAVGDAEDHELAWYAVQEVPFLLELM